MDSDSSSDSSFDYAESPAQERLAARMGSHRNLVPSWLQEFRDRNQESPRDPGFSRPLPILNPFVRRMRMSRLLEMRPAEEHYPGNSLTDLPTRMRLATLSKKELIDALLIKEERITGLESRVRQHVRDLEAEREKVVQFRGTHSRLVVAEKELKEIKEKYTSVETDLAHEVKMHEFKADTLRTTITHCKILRQHKDILSDQVAKLQKKLETHSKEKKAKLSASKQDARAELALLEPEPKRSRRIAERPRKTYSNY